MYSLFPEKHCICTIHFSYYPASHCPNAVSRNTFDVDPYTLLPWYIKNRHQICLSHQIRPSCICFFIIIIFFFYNTTFSKFTKMEYHICVIVSVILSVGKITNTIQTISQIFPNSFRLLALANLPLIPITAIGSSSTFYPVILITFLLNHKIILYLISFHKYNFL